MEAASKGQVIGGRAILRLREVSGIKSELAELARRHQKHVEDTAALGALVAAVVAPVWARDEAGKLTFANEAYARAVEVKDSSEVIECGIELFEHGGRSELLRAHGGNAPNDDRAETRHGAGGRAGDAHAALQRAGAQTAR